MSHSVSDLQLLVALVNAGSVTRAAQDLNSSLPSVSRRLAAMETRLGVRLIERHARLFQVTEEGGRLYERALRILGEISEAEAEASARGIIRGRLRIGTLQGLGRQPISSLVAEFGAKHPLLQIELRLSDKLDIIDDDLDIALQLGYPENTRLVVRQLCSSRRAVVASPNYLRRAPTLKAPEDLLHQRCICLVSGRLIIDTWRFIDNGTPREVQVPRHLLCDSGEILREWAIASRGVAFKLLWDIKDDLAQGRLKECLHEYRVDKVDLYAVYQWQRYLPARIQAFVDFIAERLPTMITDS